jgi:hypothetical protein
MGKKMNEGVKILLERIKTNPEEFYDDTNGLHVTTRWGKILTDYQNFLEPEDKNALKEAMNKLHQEKFTEVVMKELLDPKSEDLFSILPKGMRSAGTTQGQSWVNHQLAKAEAQNQVEHMKAHLNAMTREEHKTLFGRLKNYLHTDE